MATGCDVKTIDALILLIFWTSKISTIQSGRMTKFRSAVLIIKHPQSSSQNNLMDECNDPLLEYGPNKGESTIWSTRQITEGRILFSTFSSSLSWSNDGNNGFPSLSLVLLMVPSCYKGGLSSPPSPSACSSGFPLTKIVVKIKALWDYPCCAVAMYN